jgi:hypothetical protein
VHHFSDEHDFLIGFPLKKPGFNSIERFLQSLRARVCVYGTSKFTTYEDKMAVSEQISYPQLINY